MATFGSTATSAGASNNIADESNNACFTLSGLFTLSEDGRVSSIQGYLSGTNTEPGVSVMYAIYNSSRVLECFTESSKWDINGNAWIERNLTEPFNLAAGNYWLSALGNGHDMIGTSSNLAMYGAAAGGTSNLQSNNSRYQFTGNLATSTGTILYDIYATYTALVVWPRTDTATLLSGTSATLSGNLLKLSAGNATQRGFVYDTSSKVYPGQVAVASSGYASSISESGSFATGAYSLNLTNQTPGTRIYFRAFAFDGTTYNYGYEKTLDLNSLAWLTA